MFWKAAPKKDDYHTLMTSQATFHRNFFPIIYFIKPQLSNKRFRHQSRENYNKDSFSVELNPKNAEILGLNSKKNFQSSPLVMDSTEQYGSELLYRKFVPLIKTIKQKLRD